MQPDPVTLYRSPNCLFKWQVIPDKQITPEPLALYVVKKPHIRGFAHLNHPWQQIQTNGIARTFREIT
jgi:hypothetical protein